MKTITEKLKEYFDNTPEDKILSDWEKSKEWDNVGITVDKFVRSQQDIDPDIQEATSEIY